MKRTARLAPLSRDHHAALEHALELRRATEDDIAAVVAAFLAFLVSDGRALLAHEEILCRAEALGRRPEVASARELGELLARDLTRARA